MSYKVSAKHAYYAVLALLICLFLCFVVKVYSYRVQKQPIAQQAYLVKNEKIALGNTLTVGDAVVVWQPDVNITDSRKDYIERFVLTAVQEHKRFGIPASIILAQGVLESGNGKSRLATQANNHFGVKCFSKRCRKGHCINHLDDTHKDFFVKYKSAWYSYREHSKLLCSRYKHLFKRDIDGWAAGLQASGYATSKTYARDLLNIIQECDLKKFDSI